MASRVIAQRVLTGEILAWEVPLIGGGGARELSGPGGITGRIKPVDARLLGPDGLPVLREWSTALYHEVNGNIDAAGIVTRITEDEDGSLVVEAPGFSTYPHGIIHGDTYVAEIGADALDVYRHLWSYVQSFPDSDLGVTVDDLLSGVHPDGNLPVPSGPGRPVTPDNPRYRIPAWEFRDCGTEMDNLLDAASCDYIEKHAWNADRTGFTHHIALGVPRLGKKRRDLRFVEGENVVKALPLVTSGDDFAQTIYGAGRHEGRNMVRTELAQRDDRLRRTALVVDKKAYRGRLERLVRREYQRRNDTKAFDTVVVKDHPNARITDIDPGDDILVEANLNWYGRTRLWSRVMSIETALDGDETAVLHVARADAFRY